MNARREACSGASTKPDRIVSARKATARERMRRMKKAYEEADFQAVEA
jgi:hypothetical protein